MVGYIFPLSHDDEPKKPLTPEELREMEEFTAKFWTIVFAILLFIVGFLFTISPDSSTWAVIGGIALIIIGLFIAGITSKKAGIVLAIILAALYILCLFD
jgi:cell division protein FtsW (lipid II flippase)